MKNLINSLILLFILEIFTDATSATTTHTDVTHQTDSIFIKRDGNIAIIVALRGIMDF